MTDVKNLILIVSDVPYHRKVEVSVGGVHVKNRLQEISENVRHWHFELDHDRTSHAVQVETYARNRISRWILRITKDHFQINDILEGNCHPPKSRRRSFSLPRAGLRARLQDAESKQTSLSSSPFPVHYNIVGRDQYNIVNYPPGIDAKRDLKEIPPDEIEELDWYSDASDVIHAAHKKEKILQKKYADEDALVGDLKIWRDNKAPCLLQVYGRSPSGTNPFYSLLRDPGVPVQAYIMEIFSSEASTALLKTVELLKGIIRAARRLSDPSSRGCQLNVADVHVRPEGVPVFVNFDPSHFHSGDREGVTGTWDSFIRLINKSLIGHPTLRHYAAGQYGATGQTVTELTRFLLHFLWDFRYTHAKRIQGKDGETNGLICLFYQLQNAMDEIGKDVVASNDSDNPLLDSLRQRFSTDLCAIWDVWEPLSVEPGNIGYFDVTDPKRPKFHRISTVPSKILAGASRSLKDLIFEPDTAMWHCDTLADGVIRYTLRLPNDDDPSKGPFLFYRAWDCARLNRQWDVSASWEYLWNNREYMESLAREHGRKASDLCLIFSYSQSACYSEIHIQLDGKNGVTSVHPTTIIKDAGFPNGMLYFFENPAAKEGQVKGYWSASPDPGKPHWPPSTDEICEGEWSWESVSDRLRVEIPRKGSVQHIRYLSL